MSPNSRDWLPRELVKHVTAICGSDGEDWLDDLPSLLHKLESGWSLKVDPAFPAGEFNFVAPALRNRNEPVVLKISPPYRTIEIFGEAKYLRVRDGKGAVKLLAEDRDHRAILLERAVPGRNFTELFQDNEPRSIEPAIGVLRAALLPPPTDTADTISLDHWFDGLHRALATDFPSVYASKALAIYESLSARSDLFYIHGDFHPGNAVSAGRAPYLIIDPKGVIGNIGYEIAVFLNNFHWWQQKKPDVIDRLDRAVADFSDAFDVDPVELRQWAFAQMVLGAWWTREDMPEFYDNAVAIADVWNV